MQKNRVWKNRKWLELLCLIFLLMLPSRAAAAAVPIDTDRTVTLTIDCGWDGKRVSGMPYALYRVADVSSDGAFHLTGPFKDYPVSLADLDSDGWKAMAETLTGYVKRDGIESSDMGKTGEDGLAHFPSQPGSMTAGLYLTIGEPCTVGDYTYTPEVALVALPGRTAEGQWDYDVTVAPKYESIYNPPGTDKTVTRKVLKVWQDEGHESRRPEEIVVQLLEDGNIYDSVTLNDENNWRHTWTELDAKHQWQVVEEKVPDRYVVSIQQEGITFVVTNTYHRPDNPGGGDTPDRPTPTPPAPTSPDTPSLTPPETLPDHPMKTTPSGTNIQKIVEMFENLIPKGNMTSQRKLPQTGMVWWPVPVLAVMGMACVLTGWVKQRRDDGEDDEKKN